MSAPNGNSLKYATVCQIPNANGLPCGQVKHDSPLNVPIIGQPNKQIQNFIAQLGNHIHKAHPEAERELQALYQLLAALMLPYLIVRCFKTEDPNLRDNAAQFAARLRLIAQKPRVTDAEIESAVGRIDFTMEDPRRNQVIQAMQHLRDYYTELPPQQAPQSTPQSQTAS